jgi:hypothetical protein
VTGAKKISVKTGEQERIPLRFDLPPGLPPGEYKLTMRVQFSEDQRQEDSFVIHVLPPAPSPKVSGKIALFDPKGETEQLLKGLGIGFQPVDANADLSAYDLLIVGKAVLTAGGPAPDIARVRDGLKVIIFEQTSEVLEKRFGFRVTEYGLRQVFRRVPDHPILTGIATEYLRDWRGSATILPPRLKYEASRKFGGAPSVRWCDIEVTRAWRCGNNGNVVSVLIEKPAVGDFLPIVDGGFSLQYSPLMEYREGKGMVLFCQMDVNGRTESDPAAETLARNILDYVSAWKPSTRRKAIYIGDTAGKSYLKGAGILLDSYEGGNLSAGQALIVGPGGGNKLAGHSAAVGAWLKSGGKMVLIGLEEREANAFLPLKVHTKKEEYISAYFEPPSKDSPLAGVGPADVHNRDPREIYLVKGGASLIGNGVLARAEGADVVFCQLVPWQCDHKKQQNLKRTYRRVSFLVARLLANAGVSATTPILSRFSKPVGFMPEKRWLEGLYLDIPEEWDDPYRFFRW